MPRRTAISEDQRSLLTHLTPSLFKPSYPPLAGDVQPYVETRSEVDTMKPMEDRVNPDLVTDYLVQWFAIAGNPRECIARIKALEAAGINRIMLTPPRTVYHETVETLASELMPAFQHAL